MTSTRSFTPTRQGNPCLVCGDIKGRCRQTAEALNLCMDSSGVLPGFKYLGQTKDGLWAKYRIDDGQQTPADRSHFWQEQKLLRQQRAAAEAQRHADALPAQERDRLYNQLLNQLPLHPADPADLHRRGITDEQIKAWGIRSVEKWQPLTQELSHALPGLSLDGRSLITPRPGYLCPIRDVDGLIVGFQIRARASDSGRYYWLTGKTKKRPNGPTPHLSNGELPLSVLRPESIQREAIALVEGTGAKPFVLAQKLGLLTIGAAGGQFAASPETFSRSLEQLGIKTIEFYPDAGAVQNKSVLRQYRATFRLLLEWGYTVQVAWWGQTDKQLHSDIDELDDLSQIQFLSLAEFNAIALPEPLLEPAQRTDLSDRAYLVWLEEQFKNDDAQAEAHADEDFLSKIFRYFGGGKPKRKTRKRITIERKAVEENLGEYSPGAIPEHRKAGTTYKIQYRPGQETALYREAIAQGYHILDISPTGSGKTQRSGNLENRDFTFDIDGQLVEAILVYLGNDHRNPKTASVEKNFTDVPNRHNGMVIDPTRKTALDKPYVVNPKAEHGPAVERLPGNCHKATEFATAMQKGLTWATETATANPICQSCVYFGTCGDPTLDHHPGSGFRALRAESLKSPRIRMSPDQYPRNWMSDHTINIIDEASQTIAVTDTLSVTLKDHDGAWATLEQEEPALHHKLAGVRRELRRLLTGKEPRYGYSRDEIVTALKLDELNLSLDEIERIGAATSPSLAQLFGMVDRIDTAEVVKTIANLKAKLSRRNAKLTGFETEALQLKRALDQEKLGVLFGGIDEKATKAQLSSLNIDIKALKDEIKFLNLDLVTLEDEYKAMKVASKRVQNSDRTRQSEALANTFVCWLAPFLEIIFGTTIGTLSIQYGKLLVHEQKGQHRRIIHEALANIFLDATATAESLSFRTGIPPERILVCEAIHDEGAAVHHIQVPDFGLAGKKRADSTDARIKAAIGGVKSAHDGCNPVGSERSRTVVFDHLSKSVATGAAGVHFRDSRGENSFMTHDVFVHVGLPMPNIGALRIEYEILAQNSDNPLGFDAYYQDACDAELRQEMGRDRALRRTGNIFHYWLTDLELPLEAIATPAHTLSLDAASQADITRSSIAQAMAALAKEGGRMTQVAIARAANVSQGWVSKFFASMGGWAVWRAIITSLIKGSNRASNNLDLVPESLSEDERWVAQEYLALLVPEFEVDPVGVVEAVAATAIGFGSEAWARILAAADRGVVARLLGCVALVVPEWVFSGFLAGEPGLSLG
jgi:hypothetical protein